MNVVHCLVAFAFMGLCSSTLFAQDDLGRVALEHADYDKWNSVRQDAMSQNGEWIVFTVRPVQGQSLMTIRELGSQKEFTVPGGSGARFTYDNRLAAYLVQPDPELIKRLKEDKEDQLPKPKLEILDLTSGRIVTIDNVRSFRFAEEDSDWITYTPEAESGEAVAHAGESEIEEVYLVGENGLTRAAKEELAAPEVAVETKEAGTKKKETEKDDKDLGSTVVLRSLATGIERRFPNITSHEFSKRGARLAFAASAKDASADGVFLLDLAGSELSQVIAGRGAYHSLSFSEDETQLVFLSDRDDVGPEKASLSMYLWTDGQVEAVKILDESWEALPEGWWLASKGPSFTEDGRRILFETQPRPEDAGKTKEQLEKEKKDAAKDPQAKLDIWHWEDGALQPQQLLNADRERNRSYSALFDLKSNRAIQLATKNLPNVSVDRRAQLDMAVGTSSLKYEVMESWESPGFSDSYLVDLHTGVATLVLEKTRSRVSLSPEGKFLTWWDPELESYFAMSTADRVVVNITDGLPVSFANELHDTPSAPRSYGSAGWLANDAAILLYDRFDIWQVDPRGKQPARCLTKGEGRANHLRYRYVQLDQETRFIDTGEPLFLSVFDESTMASGYSTLDVNSSEIVQKIMLDERFGSLRKAEQGERLVLTRQTFRKYPDLWATTMDFTSLSRLSNANPGQRDFLWGTAELIAYETTDGQPLQGLLLKPDNFDPSKKYPMMVSFYERSSDRLHSYQAPAAGGSSINYSFYVSRGYVIFVPDIPYETRHPGESAANAILPGIQTVVDLGFIDEAHIGVQGHSWGGYQIAYLVTMSNVFAAAEAGAPVSNMTSAYGGIRWASGMSRMFQYEKTQSRIGGTLWDSRDLYLENSPVFFADNIETPLLILHNDGDGAVPWYQGIELFVAMRRLSKPAWMLNYNGEGHGLSKKENRLDFAKRMQQFFDYHLMDAPAPMWLSEGVPATLKGDEFGLEPVPAEEPASAEVMQMEVEEEAEPVEQVAPVEPVAPVAPVTPVTPVTPPAPLAPNPLKAAG